MFVSLKYNQTTDNGKQLQNMALIKCPECQRDISSDAISCPQCGHPLKAATTPPLQIQLQPPARTNIKPLGIFFIIVAIGCAIGGFYNTQETFAEKSKHELVSKWRSDRPENIRKFVRAGVTYTEASRLADAATAPFIEEAEAEIEKIKSEREQKMLYFFIPAGLFGVIGLICVASGTRQGT